LSRDGPAFVAGPSLKNSL